MEENDHESIHQSDDSISFASDIDLINDTYPSRKCWGWEFGIRKRRIRFGLLDDIDITLRYTLCLSIIVAFILYIPEDILQEHFPGSFLIGITASLIFVNPYVGAAISSSLSWTFGICISCFLAWITILIFGNNTELITQEIFLECESESTIIEGYIGDPSPSLLALLLFIIIFINSYITVSPIYGKAFVLGYSIFILLWYQSMLSPLADKLNGESFYLIARTSIVGVVMAVIFLLIPLPRWDAKPRYILSPRFGLYKARTLLHNTCHELQGLSNALNIEYQCENINRMREETIILYQVVITNCQKSITEAKSLLLSSGKWEPYFSLSLVTYDMLLSYADNLQLLSIQLNTVLLLFKDQLKVSIVHTYVPINVDKVHDIELYNILNTLQEIISSCLLSIQNNEKTDEITTHKIELQMELLRFKSTEIFKDQEISEYLNVESREYSYHCNCLWKFHNIAKTIISINNIFLHTSGSYILHRWLDWFIDFYKIWKKSFIETFILLIYKREISLRTWIFHRYKPFIGAFQIALAVTIGSLFVFIDHLRENIPSAFAIVTTAALVMDRDNPSTQFSKGESRLTGTALAVGASFIIITLFPEGSDLGTLLFLIFYSILARFMQCNPKYYYMAFSFMVTIFAILFEIAPNPLSENVTISTNGRATATTLGVIIASFCNILSPIQTRTILRSRTTKVLHSCFIPLLETIFDTHVSQDWKPKISALDMLSKVSNNIKQQRELINNATMEPILWRDPFLKDPFYDIVTNEYRLLINLLGTLKMNYTLHIRTIELNSNETLENIFEDSIVWEYMKNKLIHRIQQIIKAIETNSYVSLTSKPLMDCYVEWILLVKQRLTLCQIPGEIFISLWAILLNVKFIVEDIIRLRKSVDQLKENIRITKEEGIPLGLCPIIYLPSRNNI